MSMWRLTKPSVEGFADLVRIRTSSRLTKKKKGRMGVYGGDQKKKNDETIKPSHPSEGRNGRSTSGFHGPGKHRVHEARCAVRCSASGVKGELHPDKK